MTSVKEIQSVRRACCVLEALAGRQPAGVSELARVTGIDKSAVHRLAVTLHAAGWLEPTADGRWQIAAKAATLVRGSAVASLVAAARPVLEAVRDHTGETAMLVVPDGERLIIADAAESTHALRVSVTVGSQMPARCSSALRVLAANLPTAWLPVWRRIDPGLTDGALAEIRDRGWAFNDGEVVADTGAVGAALRDPDGQVLAALVLCGPSSRFTRERLPDLGAAVARFATDWRPALSR